MSSPARVGFVTQLPNSGGGPGDRLSGAESGESMLNALLDDGPDLAPAQADDNRAEDRNPLFMEEIVQELFEQGR